MPPHFDGEMMEERLILSTLLYSQAPFAGAALMQRLLPNTLPSKIKTLNLQLQSSLRTVILHDLRLGHLPVLSTVCLISGFDVGVSSRHSQTP